MRGTGAFFSAPWPDPVQGSAARGARRPAGTLQMAMPSHPVPASDAEKGAGERRRRPRGPAGPQPRGAGDGGPGALGGRKKAQTRKHSGRQAARHPGRTSPRDAAPEPRAPRGRDSQPTRTPTTKQGRLQRGGGGGTPPGGRAPTAGGRRTQTPEGGRGGNYRGWEADRGPGSRGRKASAATPTKSRPPAGGKAKKQGQNGQTNVHLFAKLYFCEPRRAAPSQQTHSKA